jgi:DNA-binding NarL/FixJ family response regulator
MKLNFEHSLCSRCNGALPGFSRPSDLSVPEPPVPVLLTRREQVVYKLLCFGLTNKQIATQLVISENTVRFHLKALYSKLGVRSRIRAAALGYNVCVESAAA